MNFPRPRLDPPEGFNLEIALGEIGREIPRSVACPNCGQPTPPFTIAPVRERTDIKGHWACSTCVLSANRDIVAAEEESAPIVVGWESDAGIAAKAQRTALLDRWRWTVAPDSPLDQATRDAFLAALARLHRMTVEVEDPEQFDWPELDAIPLKFA